MHYGIVRWPDQGRSAQNLLWNMINNFDFKIQPVTEYFLQVKEHFLYRRVH